MAFSPLEKEKDWNNDETIDDDEMAKCRRAVTASADNTVIVWDTRVRQVFDGSIPPADQVLTLKRHNRPVNAVAFSPDGRYLLTGSEDRRAILWPTQDWRADNSATAKGNFTAKTRGE